MRVASILMTTLVFFSQAVHDEFTILSYDVHRHQLWYHDDNDDIPSPEVVLQLERERDSKQCLRKWKSHSTSFPCMTDWEDNKSRRFEVEVDAQHLMVSHSSSWSLSQEKKRGIKGKGIEMKKEKSRRRRRRLIQRTSPETKAADPLTRFLSEKFSFSDRKRERDSPCLSMTREVDAMHVALHETRGNSCWWKSRVSRKEKNLGWILAVKWSCLHGWDATTWSLVSSGWEQTGRKTDYDWRDRLRSLLVSPPKSRATRTKNTRKRRKEDWKGRTNWKESKGRDKKESHRI